MLNEIKRSIQSILYERISSPFSGAFALSWIVWNWRPLYFIIYATDPAIKKIQFVENNYVNLYVNIFYPILSAIFLTSVYPFITTGAYWIWLWFKKKQNDIKCKFENTQTLSIEQSIALRMEIRSKEEKYNKLLTDKDSELDILRNEIKSLAELKNNYESLFGKTNDAKEYILKKEFDEVIQKDWFVGNMEDMIEFITNGWEFIDNLKGGNARISPNASSIATFIANDIILKSSKGGAFYEFTDKGKYFLKEFVNFEEARRNKSN